MSELTLTLIKLGFLALLWMFVLAVLSVIRSDLFGAKVDSRAAAAPVCVDAGVLRDLVDPRLERDRPLGLPHPPQRGDEHLLRDVLRAAVVLDHPEHEGADPALVALVEELERAIVAAAHETDELVIARTVTTLCERDARVPHSLHCALPG